MDTFEKLLNLALIFKRTIGDSFLFDIVNYCFIKNDSHSIFLFFIL